MINTLKINKMKTTEKCIVCLKKATNFSGHVIKNDGRIIIAGWCDEHSDLHSINLLNKNGCFGGWHNEYGISKMKH
jgi:hypothetical protein